MFSSLTICLLFTLGLVYSKTCPTITCGNLTYPRCYNYNKASGLGVAGTCLSNEFCDIGDDDDDMIRDDDHHMLFSNATCQSINDGSNNNGPGQPCDANNLCIHYDGVSCIDGKCQGLAINQTCSSSKQCNPGLYCKYVNSSTTLKTCSGLLAREQKCEPGFDKCEYGYECNGVCTKMFSIENDNDIALGACSSGFSSLCKQGSCMSTDDSSRELCIEPFKNTAPIDTICITCVGQSKIENVNYPVEQDCECGLNGNMYCPGFNGDEYGLKLFELTKEYYLSSAIKKCNIRASSVSCMLDYWDKDKTVEYTYYLYMSQYRMFTYKSDDCVLNRLGFVYLSLKAEYDNIKDSSSSSGLPWLIAGSALALIV